MFRSPVLAQLKPGRNGLLFVFFDARRHAMAEKTATKTAPAKSMTKSQILSGIADATGLTRKQVSSVFDAMAAQVKKSLSNRGPGAYTVPGLMKLMVVRKPATPARKGINPFTGQETMFKAKPARNVVKIRPLKNLRDMV
jgi:nucleoid DNA-binding protein